MQKLLKSINQVVGNFDGSKLTVSFYSDNSVAFYVYEQEIPIILDNAGKAYLDLEMARGSLTVDMMEELSAIIKLIENNSEVILKCLND